MAKRQKGEAFGVSVNSRFVWTRREQARALNLKEVPAEVARVGVVVVVQDL